VDRAEVDGMRELGVRWATARELMEGRGPDAAVDLVPRSREIYVSIDLDVLDISLTPGHSLPEPGGLSYRQLHAVLDRIARRGKVVGFDVVELNPALDAGEVTARTAAWLITHFLSEILEAT
jgi:agmatinase